MAGGLPDRVRLIRAVNADTAFVQGDPDHAHRAIWPGRQHVEILAPLTSL